MSSQSTEDLSQLDPELRQVYANTTPTTISYQTKDALRSKPPVPVVIPDDIEVIDVDSDGVVGKLYKLKSGKAEAPCLVWCHVR
jgi:hypothetical protein